MRGTSAMLTREAVTTACEKIGRSYINAIGLFLCLVLLARECWRAERPRPVSRKG